LQNCHAAPGMIIATRPSRKRRSLQCRSVALERNLVVQIVGRRRFPRRAAAGAARRRALRTRPAAPLAPGRSALAAAAVQQVRQLGGSLHDLLCTATHFVARGITTAARRFLPPGQRIHRVLLSGGGVRNGLLWNLLGQSFEGIPLQRTDEVGVPADLRKALSFGMLAALTLDGVPANVPSATGAAGSRLLGSLTPGSSINWGRCLAWMATQTTTPFSPEI